MFCLCSAALWRHDTPVGHRILFSGSVNIEQLTGFQCGIGNTGVINDTHNGSIIALTHIGDTREETSDSINSFISSGSEAGGQTVVEMQQGAASGVGIINAVTCCKYSGRNIGEQDVAEMLRGVFLADGGTYVIVAQRIKLQCNRGGAVAGDSYSIAVADLDNKAELFCNSGSDKCTAVSVAEIAAHKSALLLRLKSLKLLL